MFDGTSFLVGDGSTWVSPDVRDPLGRRGPEELELSELARENLAERIGTWRS